MVLFSLPWRRLLFSLIKPFNELTTVIAMEISGYALSCYKSLSLELIFFYPRSTNWNFFLLEM